MDESMKVEAFPIDWTEWREWWNAWKSEHASDLKRTSERFEGKNFLADEILGTWKVNGRLVELSEVTFPDFGSRSMDARSRYVGVTFGIGADGEGGICATFAELETMLGIAS